VLVFDEQLAAWVNELGEDEAAYGERAHCEGWWTFGKRALDARGEAGRRARRLASREGERLASSPTQTAW
jgi:hypothetical protein